MMKDVVHACAFNLSGWAPYCIPSISFTLPCYKVVQLLLFHSEAISRCEVQFNVKMVYMSVCSVFFKEFVAVRSV